MMTEGFLINFVSKWWKILREERKYDSRHEIYSKISPSLQNTVPQWYKGTFIEWPDSSRKSLARSVTFRAVNDNFSKNVWILILLLVKSQCLIWIFNLELNLESHRITKNSFRTFLLLLSFLLHLGWSYLNCFLIAHLFWFLFLSHVGKLKNKVSSFSPFCFQICWPALQRWHDEFLTWAPEEFNETKAIHIPATMIWTPDIMIHNRWGSFPLYLFSLILSDPSDAMNPCY